MKRWKKTLDLSAKWGDNWNNTNIHEMGMWVAKQIKLTIKDYTDYDKYGFELEDIISGFEDICTLERAILINKDNYQYHLDKLEKGEKDTFYEIVPLEEFDNLMSDLYDFCDRESIWVERAKGGLC